MGYNDPDPASQNAIRQINDARHRALKAVSEMRQADITQPHRNLSPAQDGSKSLPVVCSQAVVDYLIHLRPYRHQSQNWGIDFGTVQLPKQIAQGKSKRLGQSSTKPPLWCCHQPEIPVSNASELIQAVNNTVYYSTNKQSSENNTPGSDKHKLRLPDRVLLFDDIDDMEAVMGGSVSAEEALSFGMAITLQEEKQKESQYEPAVPWVSRRRSNTGGSVKAYKVVFPSDRLLQIVEHADEIAAEMDMLADIEPPDHSATGAGAV